MRTDPTDNGGLFVGRRPGTAPVRYRALPERGSAARQRVDRLIAVGLLALQVLVNLCFWGPLPAAWLWIGSQVQVLTDSVSFALLVTFVGLMLTLVFGLQVLKRIDGAWILVRRAAGYDQRRGVIGPVFATVAVIGGGLFTFWLLFLGGLATSMAPTG